MRIEVLLLLHLTHGMAVRMSWWQQMGGREGQMEGMDGK